MRVESYKREIDDYRIVGTFDNSTGNVAEHQHPLELMVYDGRDRLTSDKDWQQLVVPWVDSDYFHREKNPELYEVTTDFRENYLAILKGEISKWQLSYAEITPSVLSLTFDNPSEQKTEYSLWITSEVKVGFQIMGPEIMHGVRPIYKVFSEYGNMTVVEEIGFTKRKVHFRVKDPSKTRDNVFHHGNQYVEVTEYSCV